MKTTDFIGNFVYVDGIPAWNNFDEGRVVYQPSGAYFYENYIKDHLGSVRVTYSKSGTTTNVRDVFSYYPFGMTINSLTATSVTARETRNEYLYNGKMFQDELGLNWLDYGARFHDAVVGRWWSVDPLAEQSRRWSPYNYCVDNPMRFIDPDGMNAIIPGDPPLLWATKGAENAGKIAVEVVSDAVDYISSDKVTTPVGNAADIAEAGAMALKNPILRDASGQIGNGADAISITRDAVTTDFNNQEQKAEFVSNTVQTVVEVASGPAGSATHTIIEDSKKENGVTNTKNMTRNYMSSYKASNSYIYKNFTLRFEKERGAQNKKTENNSPKFNNDDEKYTKNSY